MSTMMQKLTDSNPSTPSIITCPADDQNSLDMATLEKLLASFKTESSAPNGQSNDNPSYNLSQAQALASLLSSGPSITSDDTGKLLVPIATLCSPTQSPIIRSAGYTVITALCGSNGARSERTTGAFKSDVVLTTLERRKIWEALCAAGSEWFPETSVARIDALEALLDIGQREGKEAGEDSNDTTTIGNGKVNVEGLDGLLTEITAWMASAVDSVLSAQEEARHHPHGAPSHTDRGLERSEEDFIERLDAILSIVTKSDSMLLHEHDLSKLLELYSSWVDRAVRDEFRAVHAHAALSACIVSQQQIRAPRFHGRASSTSTTPTTFTFPSSVVTPAEATLGVSRGPAVNFNSTGHAYHANGGGGASSIGENTSKPPYVVLGPLFLNQVERCLKQNVLIPTDTLPRVIESACYLLSLTMKPITTPAAYWDNSGDYSPVAPAVRTRENNTSGVRSSASSSIRQPRSSASASQSQEASANASPRVSQRRALPAVSREDIQDPISPPPATESSIDQRTMSLLESLLHDNWYSASALHIVKQQLRPPLSMTSTSNGSPSTLTVKPPTSPSNAPLISQGATRALRFAILNALMSELAREQLNDWVTHTFAMGGAPTLYGNMDQQQLLDFSWKRVVGAAGGGLGVRFEKLGVGLGECVKAWREVSDDAGTGAREEVLMECCALVTDVLSLSPKGEVGEVPRFVGELVKELALIVKDYRSGDGSIHRLRLSSASNAFASPTLLLNSVAEILRLPLSSTTVKPSLASTLISLSDHLNDADAVTVIQHLESTSELYPSSPDWADTFRTLMHAFCTNARTYPKARRLITLQLRKVYSDLTDIDSESLRAEIVEDMLEMWEKTLHEEANEDILNAAFDITSTEIVLATMIKANTEADGDAEEAGEKRIDWTSIAERIRCIWMKVAVTAPPYYENDKIASLSPAYAAGISSPPIVPTPSAEPTQHQILHSAGPSLPVNSLNSNLSASSSTIYEQSAINAQADLREQSQSQAQPQGHPAMSRQGRAVLAAIFLIKAFNKLAFRSPQSLTILLSDAGRRQSASAARMAIALFRNIVQLVGPDLDSKGRKPASGTIKSESASEERLQCPKARLVILQWLLRLRADRDHRIYGVGEIENEVLPLARMIYRADPIKPVNQVPQDERPDRDLPSALAARRRNRAETKGAADIRMHRNLERDRENTSREHTREPRGRGHTDPLSASASRSRSRPPASPQTTYTVPRPRETLWSLPETLAIELEKHATRPSPAMATFTSIRGEEGKFWLHVDYYVQTLASLLEHERDWEIVSYILCHLPLQLANKHFFCGPKSAIQIRKLVLIVCNAINEDKLSSSMETLLPSELLQVDIQALLYHTLMVLISYHRLFDPQVGEYDQNAKSIKLSIVEVIITGLARDEVTSRPCLEALSLAVYELTDQVAKFTERIIEKLSRIMSNPNMAVHILELLMIIGYTPKLYSGSFREEDYQRVFAVAILYIEHHYRPDAKTLRTNDGRDSYALAQHVLNTAFFVIYVWFLAIKLEDRARYVTFIVNRLITANNKREVLEPSTEVCFDWLARYAYSNADPKAAPSFLHRSIVAPGSGAFNVNRSWEEQHRIEVENTTGIKAWKLGNSIVTISTMKKPPGWVRIVSRRPSGLTEMICRLENWPHVSPGDFAPDLVSMPVTMLADRPVNYEVDESLDVDEVSLFSLDKQAGIHTLTIPQDMLQSLISDIVEQADVIQDIQKPDPISGYVWSGVAPSQRRKEITIDPAYIALLLSSYPSGMMTRPSRFLDYNSLKATLMAIDYTPVIDTHKVGVVYVAPGQTKEVEIFSNQNGSPAYTRFLANLGRVIKPSSHLEVYTGGLRPETHGSYAYSWWDDMSQIIYHVATIMPNINNGMFKKQEIGNDGVKIVWNDSGAPFKFDTILSEYTLVNVVVEPHSFGARGAYSDNRHENEFFKVTLQTAPSLPRITPIGEYKIISAEKLSMALRHFTLQASLFCKAWEHTGMDGPTPIPLQTNWQGRLKYIKNSESKLPPKIPAGAQLNGAAHREGSRDFTLSY